jgi:hypothetical protein
MKALSEIPLEIRWYCPEEKEERVFKFAGIARFGYFYICEVCSREVIIEDKQLDWIIEKGLAVK